MRIPSPKKLGPLVGVLCVLFQVTASHNMLFLTSQFPSHLTILSSLAQPLAEAGHNVTFAIASNTPEPEVRALRNKGLRVLTYQTEVVCNNRNQTLLPETTEAFITENQVELRHIYAEFTGCEQQGINDMMEDVEFVDFVRKNRYDLAIVDAFFVSFSRFVLPCKLEIPYVGLTTNFHPWLQRVPALPSFVPVRLMKLHTEKMNFSERMLNMALYAYMSYSVEMTSSAQIVATWNKYLPGTPPPSIFTLQNRAELTLYNIDDLSLDYPTPVMPNTILVGGLTIEPNKTLSKEFRTILDASQHGVMLVAFGSVLSNFKEHRVQRIFDVLEKVQLPVIMRYAGSRNSVPSNVKIFKWIPQNDLLAHPKVQVFMTHCGNNGQLEAVYHGVPMVGVPFFGDQPFNAVKMEYRGYGRKCDIFRDPVEQSVATILDVLKNDTYRKNVKLASRIFRDRPDTPRQRAVYWIEQVLKFGSSHLRSHANDLPLYQYWMMDVLIFLSACFTIVIVIFVVAIKKCIRTLTKYRGNTVKLKTN